MDQIPPSIGRWIQNHATIESKSLFSIMKCCKKHVGSQTGMEVIYNNPSPPAQPTPGNRWTTWIEAGLSAPILYFQAVWSKDQRKHSSCLNLLWTPAHFFLEISQYLEMELKSAKTKLVEQWVPIQEGCWRLCPWCQEWHRAGWLELESESPWLYSSLAVNLPSCVH